MRPPSSGGERTAPKPGPEPPFVDLGAAEIVTLIRAGELSCVEVATAVTAAIAERDGPVRAFEALAGRAAIDRAAELDALPPESAAELPLLGVPVAIKDVFDTADLPTGYGSAIYAGSRPRSDAAVVTLLLAAGAVVVGKTKTSEFACMTAADTRNPLDLERTPGGSSSGSAAAVAAGMVPLATGTQTAGSIIRPAAYCGIFGLKPSSGAVPLSGAMPTSITLDTAGMFARSVADLELALSAITAAPAGTASARASRPAAGAAELSGAPRLGFLRIGWELIEEPARNAIERYLEAAASAGAHIEETELPASFDRLAQAQLTIQLVETAAALGAEADRHGDLVSRQLRDYIAEGRAVAPERYLDARRLADEQRWLWSERIEAFDAVLAPSTLGVPPLGLASTGDPLLCRPFTLLGGPALALPGAFTPEGLPVGIQLVGAPQRDRAVLAAGAWLSQRVPARGDASTVGS